MRRQSSGRFLYVALRTALSAAEGHFESASTFVKSKSADKDGDFGIILFPILNQ